MFFTKIKLNLLSIIYMTEIYFAIKNIKIYEYTTHTT